MAAKIIEAPKIAETAPTFSTETLAPMSSADGGLPKSSGPTEDQIKASGWFKEDGAGGQEGDKKTDIKPEAKKIVVKEAIEESLEDGEKTATEGGLTDGHKETEVVADESKEESDLPDFLKPPKEEVASGEERKQVDKPLAGTGKLAAGKPFDYTGFSSDETRHLKNMDKGAREFTAGLIKKSKEVVTNETSYLQHPNGYMLAPEYQSAQANFSSMTQQYNHWKTQLLNARAGKPVQDIAIDPKTGKIVITGEYQPNDEIEEQCRQQMMSIQQKAENERSVITSFPQRFKETLTKDTMAISKVLEAKCPWVAKPELLKYKMDVPFSDGTMHNISLGEVKQNFLNQFPPYMRNGNIGIEIAANMWVGYIIKEKQAEAANSGKKVAQTKVAEGRRAEPGVGGGKKLEVKKVGGVGEFSTVNAGIEFGV